MISISLLRRICRTTAFIRVVRALYLDLRMAVGIGESIVCFILRHNAALALKRRFRVLLRGEVAGRGVL